MSVCVRVCTYGIHKYIWLLHICRTKVLLESIGYRTRPLETIECRPRITQIVSELKSTLVENSWYQSNKREYTGSNPRFQEGWLLGEMCMCRFLATAGLAARTTRPSTSDKEYFKTHIALVNVICMHLWHTHTYTRMGWLWLVGSIKL